MATLALLVLLIGYLAFSVSAAVATARRLFPSAPAKIALVGGLLLPYLLARLPAADPADLVRDLATLALYLFAPTLLLLARPPRRRPLDLSDVLAVLCLWLPLEMRWLPEVPVRLAPGMSLPLVQFTAVCLALVLYRIVRPIEPLGFSFKLSRRDVGIALLATAVFFLFAVPLGLAIGFMRIQLGPLDAAYLLALPVGGYLLIALPEELLFRGIIQNLIEQRFGRGTVSLLAAALIFGLSHLNNTSNHHSPLNWHFVLMATLAGLAYGWVWRRTDKITAAALTHALVNWGWLLVFRG